MSVKIRSLRERMRNKPVRAEDLIVLVYAHNSCYTQVAKLDLANLPDGILALNLARGTWIARLSVGQSRPLQIGECLPRPPVGSRRGIIGIYDRTSLTHLNAMVLHAQTATREDRWSED